MRIQSDTVNFNKLLEELYLSKWESLSDKLISFNEEEPDDKENLATHPLLLKVNPQYEDTNLKIMFFGQETNQWGGELNDGIFSYDADMEFLLSLYEDFFLNQGYEQYGKPFWNFIRRIRSVDSISETGYVWNNVLKIGKCEAGTPQQGLINHTLNYFNVIPDEINILKPDVLLFFTGPRYDKYIEKHIGTYKIYPINGFKPNELCRLEFSFAPTKLALRTYHPGFLQRLGKKRLDDVFNTIIERLTN